METHVLDLEGPYALFRKPYAPVSPVSFPFPPPPTVMGIIGAICGYGKDEYLDRVGWDETRIGVGIREPLQRFRTGINLINTKEGNFYDAVGENQRIQIPHEFLKGEGDSNVRFRVYVADGPEAMMDELRRHLEAGTTTYSLGLGLSECLAHHDYVGTFDAEQLSQGVLEVDSVVPDDAVERVIYEPEHQYGHYRIPERMAPGRRVDRYSVTVAEETANPIEVETGEAYGVGEDRVVFH